MSIRECEAFQRSMDLLSDTEGAGEPDEKLLEHMKVCTECARTFELMGRLRKAHMHEDPSDDAFLAMRLGVLREIRRSGSRAQSLLERLGILFRRPVLLAAASFLLAGMGFLAGRRTSASRPPMQGSWAASEDALVSQIKLAALQNHGPQDLDRAPYTYENVNVNDVGAGQVALSFDVSRHVDLRLPKHDPIVADVLMQTLANPAPAGTKLQVISCAGTNLDPKVRDGLVKAMLYDANLGVRLMAQSKLIEQNSDPKVTDALLRVLQNEESVQMKLVAIDYLTRHKVEPGLIRRAIAPSGRRDAVYIQAMNYLNGNGGQP